MVNNNTLPLSSQTEIFSRLETLFEEAYDLLQMLRDPQDEAWFTPDIQVQVREAQAEVERGEYKEFDSAKGLITHLHSMARPHEQTQDNPHLR